MAENKKNSSPAPKAAPSAPAKAAYKPPISSKLAATPINHFMTRRVVYASPSTTIRIAMQMMLNHKISGLTVIDNSGTCLGVYSELDAMLQGAAQPLDSPIRYTKPAITAYPDTSFREVLLLIVTKKLKRVPIIDARKKLLGIVSRRDLMKALFEDNV